MKYKRVKQDVIWDSNDIALNKILKHDIRVWVPVNESVEEEVELKVPEFERFGLTSETENVFCFGLTSE